MVILVTYFAQYKNWVIGYWLLVVFKYKEKRRSFLLEIFGME